MTNSMIEQRLAKVEAEMGIVKGQVTECLDMKTLVAKISLLSEQQAQYNKEFAESNKMLMSSNIESSMTFKNINRSLKSLVERMDSLESKVDVKFEGMDKKFDGVDKKFCEMSDNSKIDIVDMAKMAVPGLIGSGIVFVILRLVGVL